VIYRMPTPPEEALLPFCEANEEWRTLKAKEILAWRKLHEPYHRGPCEPADFEDLRRAGLEARYWEAVGDRVHVQAHLRLDRLQLNRNLNEQ